MDNSTYEMRLSQWAQIVKAASERPSGQMLKDWLAENDISKDKYYYWQRKVRKAAYDTIRNTKDLPAVADKSEVTFAEVPLSFQKESSNNSAASQIYNAKPVAMIQIGRATIAVTNDVSDVILSRILQEVSHA